MLSGFVLREKPGSIGEGKFQNEVFLHHEFRDLIALDLQVNCIA